MNKRIRFFPAVAVLLLSALFTGCDTDPGGDPEGDDLPQAKVIILQAAGTGTATDGNVSHSFVELYNAGDTEADLSGWALYYREDFIDTGAWDKLDLTGKIPAKHSYFVKGSVRDGDLSVAAPNLNLTSLTEDKIWNKTFSNRGFSILLRSENSPISSGVVNPFDEDLSGYVDLLGVYNGAADAANILAFETEAVGDITKQSSARRTSAVDTDDNSADFVKISYRPWNEKEGDASEGVTDEIRDYYKPHNVTTAWGTEGPFSAPAYPPPPPPSDGLMIFQVYGTGIAPTTNDGGVTHSFIELYNNSASAIPLNTYSIQIAVGSKQNKVDAVEEWTKYNLTGTIPAHGSYFIRGKSTHTDQGTNASLLILDDFTPDLDLPSVEISNRAFKVALVSNQTLLTALNPFDTDGNGTKVQGYVDQLGAINSTGSDEVGGFEKAVAAVITKQASARRSSLADTDDNSADFVKISYNNTNLDNRAKFKPRNTASGSWTPEF
jgi:hypothetical protein